ncbi:triosephosphate isomerase [Quadrisphaera granulorum]|uniref:Triosephosphate isomerase n=2 Tax=Quadrisphaera granulorum TaxID=317664 RepID=A0A315ZYA9_9ACTN|nr:triose-phosphate isomerase [Quadrisphaera granulorum]PWJ50651.1 triosephosphate isomerase [Quadrisphaera granulorum]SZE97899.1 triosephosphate isomerase [Quadrisphaera granulorum]
MARTPLMAGNWKMNVDHVQATALVQRLAWTLRDAKHDPKAVEAVVIPPFTDLRSVQTLIEGDKLELGLGAQDVSAHEPGARTGEVAASMLARLGVQYVVVGHSERRQYHGEDDALVAAKAAKVLEHGMTPIVCLGESLEVREAGEHVADCVSQLDGSLAGVSAEDLPKVVVAYEPVWAIGTGKVATPDDAQEVCAALRARLADQHGAEVADAVRVLYGGSVKSSNVAAIMAGDDVDGALVGGASLDAGEFAGIVTGGAPS